VAPLAVPDELVVEAEARPLGAAEDLARVPGTERFGGRGVRRVMRDPQEMLDVIQVWARLTAAYVQ
jgi:hypothetical protein